VASIASGSKPAPGRRPWLDLATKRFEEVRAAIQGDEAREAGEGSATTPVASVVSKKNCGW